MTKHLIFTLSATMGSMGELAGHERRGSWEWPGRSAILGLIGAAMGIRRDGDFSSLDCHSLSVAVFETGQPLRDFHTVQTVPTAAVKHPESRPIALRLAGDKTNTILTQRDYRVGSLFGIAVTGDDLESVAASLRHPRFTLYLGRKSCPLSAPLAPLVVDTDTIEQALLQLTLPPWYPSGELVAKRLYTDIPGMRGTRSETRHDVPLDRGVWHFGERRVEVLDIELRPERSSG